MTCIRSSRPEVFCKKDVLRNFEKIHKKTPVPESLTPTQRFSCEFCEISKNTFSHRTPPVAACLYCQREVTR